jgi:hypothetical protein
MSPNVQSRLYVGWGLGREGALDKYIDYNVCHNVDSLGTYRETAWQNTALELLVMRIVTETGARICKPFKEPRNRFPALRAGTTTLFVVPAFQAT